MDTTQLTSFTWTYLRFPCTSVLPELSVAPKREKPQNPILGWIHHSQVSVGGVAQGHCEDNGLWRWTGAGFKFQLCNFVGG